MVAQTRLTRMDETFAAERHIYGRSADERLAYRQTCIAPLVTDLERYLRQQYARLSRKRDLAIAINYILSRWDSFARFVNDGRIYGSNGCKITGFTRDGIDHLEELIEDRKTWTA